jgi:hypothetical protein
VVTTSQPSANEMSYRNLKRHIDDTYPKGRFIAICQGQIAAEAESIEELLSALRSRGKDAKECLAVQAGVDHPDYAIILLRGVED